MKKLKTKSEKNREQEILNLISKKILEYQSLLAEHPPKLKSISDSDHDRKQIDDFYPFIAKSSTKILDSQFYSHLLSMQRERDKNILREGTTRKERIAYLAGFMQRLTSPILFLNHIREIQLTDIWNDNKSLNSRNKKVNDDSKLNHQITNLDEQILLDDSKLKVLRHKLLQKLEKKTWTLAELNKTLTHWEADLLSQLTRDSEVLIKLKNKNELEITINRFSDQIKESQSNKTWAIVLEPKIEDKMI